MLKKLKNIARVIYKYFISANRYALESGVRFGENCKFLTKNFGSEPYLIRIGDNFYSSSNVQFVTHDGAVNVIRNLHDKYKNVDIFKPIVIGDNLFIGYGSVLLPGTMIGNNVIVGAASLVKGELKDNGVYAGSPAKYICSVDEYLARNIGYFIPTKNLDPLTKREKVMEWVKGKYPNF